MDNIVKLRDIKNDSSLPVTHEIAVRDSNGTTLETKLQIIDDKLGSGNYDISAHNSGATYANLSEALGTNGANVPTAYRKGGMSVKFVQSIDHKYVEYRYLQPSYHALRFSSIQCWEKVENSTIDIARITAVKTELDYDWYDNKTIRADGSFINSSDARIYIYNNDGYDYIYTRLGGIVSGRVLAFYNSTTPSAESCIHVITAPTNQVYDCKYAVPVDCQLIVVAFPVDANKKPTIDLKIALGKSNGYFGKYDANIATLNTDATDKMLELARSTAVKTETNYDSTEGGKYLNANGNLNNSSANGVYLYNNDNYDYLIAKCGGNVTGKTIAFYNSTTPSSESLIGSTIGYGTVSIVKIPIPANTVLIAVAFPRDTTTRLPTIDLKIALGKSNGYFGKYDSMLDTLNKLPTIITDHSVNFVGAGNTNKTYTFYTKPGRRYRISRNRDSWDISGITSAGTEIFALYSYKDDTGTRVEYRTKSSTTIFPNPYDFTANDVNYYTLYFKGTSGEKVTCYFEDISELSPITGIGSTDLITLMGGRDKMNNTISNLKMGGNTLVLLYFSDVHNGIHALQQAVNMKNKLTGINDVLSGGDNVNDQPTDTYSFFAESLNGDGRKILTVVGNHDVYSGNTKLTSKQVFDIYYGEHTESWTGVTFPNNYAENGLCYWYKDYSTLGIRLIGLDCINWDSAENTWLASVLADAITNSYHVLICLHYKPNSNFAGIRECTFNSLFDMSAQYAPNDVAQTVQTAINNGLKFVCYLFGHEHKDFFGNITGYENQYALAADKPIPGVNGEYRSWDLYNKNYYSFDLIAVDKAHGIMSVVKVGNNRDKFERPMNMLAFDYINHKIVGNY